MAVQIDRIDSEIEIVPSASSSTLATSRGSTPAQMATAAGHRDTLRGAVMRVLADELEEFLRSRGA